VVVGGWDGDVYSRGAKEGTSFRVKADRHLEMVDGFRHGGRGTVIVVVGGGGVDAGGGSSGVSHGSG
jgi:hypothetical protein